MPSARVATKYVESSLSSYWRRVIVYGVLFYSASVIGLALAVAPGIIYASLQTSKGSTPAGSYNLIVIITVVCSSIASVITALLSLFVLRHRFSESKRIYYGMRAEYTLYKSGTGPYTDNPAPHLVLLDKMMGRMEIHDAKSFVKAYGRSEASGTH